MKTSSYFAYGINMDRGHLRGLCSNAMPISQAVLPGYRFVINRAGWATVVPADGFEVHGALWRVSEPCLELIDRFEGVDEGLYRRARLPVSSPAGETTAEIYLALDEEPGVPEASYIRAIIQAAKVAGAPEVYLRELERWGGRGIEPV